MANNGNLVPWKPGQSGNPKGRPKYSGSLTKLLAEILKQDHLCDKPMPDGRTVAHVLMECVVAHAIAGKASPLLSELIARVDGKVPDPEPPAPEVNMEAVAMRNAERIAKKKRKKAE